jgi:Signal peptide peptidase
MLNLGSTSTGLVLLWGLFVYDIFWVFFTPVMVTVATKIDGPIKLLFPTRGVAKKFNMLGLGDIVIPGAPPMFHVARAAAHAVDLSSNNCPTFLCSRCSGAEVWSRCVQVSLWL